jgi:hypothetical protein
VAAKIIARQGKIEQWTGAALGSTGRNERKA